MRARVRNDASAAQAATVNATLVRADGSVQARLARHANVAAGATQEVTATATVASPHLWNGVADPYVYSVYVEVAGSAGATAAVAGATAAGAGGGSAAVVAGACAGTCCG